jgi:acyl-CoA synthetase (AMP-forming)/AMP-acid ligase II
MLRGAVANALAGRGGFRLLAQGMPVAAPAARLDGPPGGAVLWPMENSAFAIWQLLAALDAGMVPLLLPPGQPASKLAALRARFTGFGLRTADGVDWPAAPARLDPSLYLGLLTSGSTGDPKAIVTSAQRLSAGVRAIHAAQGLDALQSTAVLLPLAYSYACVNQLMWAVLMGRELHLPGPLSDLAACMERIRAGRVEMLCLVAHQAGALQRFTEAFDSVRCVNFAGSPFPMQQFDALRAVFPHARLLNNYGCAEAMPRLCCTEVVDATASTAFVGQPIGDLALRISGGAIEFQGGSTALGTIAPDGTLQPFDAWSASGDLGILDDDGLRVLGRHDQVIKIGGERLSLLDIEQAFAAFGASQVLVWLEPGERIVAVMEMAAAPELRTLLQFLRQHLPRPLLPAAIYLAADWPLNANQKTDRALLQQRAREGVLTALWPASKKP